MAVRPEPFAFLRSARGQALKGKLRGEGSNLVEEIDKKNETGWNNKSVPFLLVSFAKILDIVIHNHTRGGKPCHCVKGRS